MLLPMPLPKERENPKVKADIREKAMAKAAARRGKSGVQASGSLGEHLANSMLWAIAPRDGTVRTFTQLSNKDRLVLLLSRMTKNL